MAEKHHPNGWLSFKVQGVCVCDKETRRPSKVRVTELSYKTKRLVYKAVVLGIILYGSETWTTKHFHVRKLEVFHKRCMRTIMGISSVQQRLEHISTIQVAKRFGMEESLEDIIAARCLRWLGHMARMDDHRLPKKVLFGWLPQRRPAHGTKIRWRDRVRKDMMKFKIEERSWFSLAQERSSWRGKCRAGLEEATRKRVEEDALKCTANAVRSAGGSGSVAATKPFHCDTCLRSFRRPQYIARHRCVTTRPRGQVMRPSAINSVCHFVAEKHHPNE